MTISSPGTGWDQRKPTNAGGGGRLSSVVGSEVVAAFVDCIHFCVIECGHEPPRINILYVR